MPALLDRLRLGHGEVQIEATPRRLALLISQLAVHQRGAENKLRGPPAKVTLPLTVTTLPCVAPLSAFCFKPMTF